MSFVVAAHRQVTGNSVIYLDAQKTIQVSPEAQTLGGSQNIREDLNHFNKGIAALAGVSYKLKKGKLLLEVGGNYGFYNIQRHEQEGTNYSYAAMLVAGYQLPLNYKPGSKRKMLE